MCILLIFLYQDDLLDEVMEALVELEVGDAVALEGRPMEQVLADEVPIFSGLWQTIGEGHTAARLVVAPLPDRTLVDPLFRLLAATGVDLNDPGVGRLCLLPAEFPTAPEPSAP